MGKCSMRFAVLSPGDAAALAQGLGISNPPKYLACELEADHGGRHYDSVVGWWQFVATGPGPLEFLSGAAPDATGHVNCRCELVPIESDVQLPAWWVAERCDEVFGVTSPRIFHALEL